MTRVFSYLVGPPHRQLENSRQRQPNELMDGVQAGHNWQFSMLLDTPHRSSSLLPNPEVAMCLAAA